MLKLALVWYLYWYAVYLVDYVERIYPIELGIKDTTYTVKSASHLDFLQEIDNVGQLKTKLNDKRENFSFQMVNFTFLCSNIPAAPENYLFFITWSRFGSFKFCISDYRALMIFGQQREIMFSDLVYSKVFLGNIFLTSNSGILLLPLFREGLWTLEAKNIISRLLTLTPLFS